MTRIEMFRFGSIAGFLFLGLSLAPLATAQSIVVNGTFNFLDNRSDNSVGQASGLRNQFGAASVIPNGSDGTSGIATQGAATVPLNFFPFAVAPNYFANSISANPALNGPWTLTFSNPSAPNAVVSTQSLAGASAVPFVNSVTISPGPTPTFTWTTPSSFTPDAVRIQIYDTTNFVGTGGVGGTGNANVINQTVVDKTATSFTVDTGTLTGPLVSGHSYSFAVMMLDLRNPLGPANDPNTLSRSTSFFDFNVLPDNAPASVFLPTLNSGATPFYSFNIADVGPGHTTFIDPFVATGYDYQKGASDPNFGSVTLPTGIGDNLYHLSLFDAGLGQYVDSGLILSGGTTFSFGPLGVDRFRIDGIETSAGLDPNNTTAFITGLTFVGDGNFTGTMTPLVTAVPEPETYAMLLAGLGLLGFAARRRKPKEVALA